MATRFEDRTLTASYMPFKKLEPNMMLWKRVSDGEVFIGHPFEYDKGPLVDSLRQTVERGMLEEAGLVLNHPNLLCPVSTESMTPLDGTGADPHADRQIWLLWDYCDRGTLEQMLPQQPLLHPTKGWLPEGFLWHVALGMLSALMWLQEGLRETYDTEEVFDGGEWHEVPKLVIDTAREPRDWWPVMHRDICAENIFLQSPRGRETYPTVKLGNFGSCFVSGVSVRLAHLDCTVRARQAGKLQAVNRLAKRIEALEDRIKCVEAELSKQIKDPSSSVFQLKKLRDSLLDVRQRKASKEAAELPATNNPEWQDDLVTNRRTFEDTTIEDVKHFDARYKEHGAQVRPRDRPYYIQHEMSALGRILYRMMTGNKLPSFEECDPCGCEHIKFVDDGSELKLCLHTKCFWRKQRLVHNLLDDHLNYSQALRDMVVDMMRMWDPHADKVFAREFLEDYHEGYILWRLRSRDGNAFRGIHEDMRERAANLAASQAEHKELSIRTLSFGTAHLTPAEVARDGLNAKRQRLSEEEGIRREEWMPLLAGPEHM